MNGPWQARAACAQLPPDQLDAFYFPTGPSAQIARAKATCRTCPVRLQCLNHALAHNIQQGIWGGLTENQRHQLRRNISKTETGNTQ